MTFRDRTSRSDVGRFLRSVTPYLRARPVQTLLVVCSVIPTIAFTTVQPLLLKALVDDAILPRNHRAAILLVVALAVLLIVDAAGELANRVLVTGLTISITNEIRLRLFEHAHQLSISFKTVGRHVEHIYAKTGCSTRASASLFAVEHDLV